MKLIKPSIEFLNMTNAPLESIEAAGRTCYKSEAGISRDSALAFVKKLLDRGHLAMIEHAWASYRVICDRGVTHEIVRHRLFSYAQESTRYCNYKGGVTFIIPPWLNIPEEEYEDISEFTNVFNAFSASAHWVSLLLDTEALYIRLINKSNWSPQQARSVLPNALKTEIIITGNMREWLHFLTLRTAKTAHPQMQEIANMILKSIKYRVPVIFDNI